MATRRKKNKFPFLFIRFFGEKKQNHRIRMMEYGNKYINKIPKCASLLFVFFFFFFQFIWCGFSLVKRMNEKILKNCHVIYVCVCVSIVFQSISGSANNRKKIIISNWLKNQTEYLLFIYCCKHTYVFFLDICHFVDISSSFVASFFFGILL